MALAAEEQRTWTTLEYAQEIELSSIASKIDQTQKRLAEVRSQIEEIQPIETLAENQLAEAEKNALQIRKQVLRYAPLKLEVAAVDVEGGTEAGVSAEGPFTVQLSKGDHSWSVHKGAAEVAELKQQLFVNSGGSVSLLPRTRSKISLISH
jgi:hypothetical protein